MEAGRRGQSWRKVKPVHTYDLVVLAAEWGHGRRHGWLSNLHLGARDDDGSFVMVGKTFKGLTDELLRWQTEALLAREVARDGIVVHVRPELVFEIALDGVQVSRRYAGGVALRFARVRRYRSDKAPAEAPAGPGAPAPEPAVPADLQAYLDQREREILVKALRETGFNRTAAAQRLGLSLRQIRYRIARLAIATPGSEDADDTAG